MPRSTVLRPVSRVLLVDSEDRLLLFDTTLAYTRAWLAPGGALEEGETYEEAGLRELEEETGLRGVSLGPWVWTVEFRFVYGGLIYDQRERYFVARTRSRDVTRSLWSATEAMEIIEPRWWTLDEIKRSRDDFRPANAADLLPDVIAGRYPAEPLRAIVERSASTV